MGFLCRILSCTKTPGSVWVVVQSPLAGERNMSRGAVDGDGGAEPATQVREAGEDRERLFALAESRTAAAVAGGLPAERDPRQLDRAPGRPAPPHRLSPAPSRPGENDAAAVGDHPKIRPCQKAPH